MRDISNLLWCDLISDEERMEFIISGRAEVTGIIAPSITQDLFEVYREVMRLKVRLEEIEHDKLDAFNGKVPMTEEKIEGNVVASPLHPLVRRCSRCGSKPRYATRYGNDGREYCSPVCRSHGDHPLWPRGKYNGMRIVGIEFKIAVDVTTWRWIPVIGHNCGMCHWLCFLSWTSWKYET